MRLIGILMIVAAVATTGCQTRLGRLDKGPEPALDSEVTLPFPEPEGGPEELDGDIVYSYLVGEIGAQRGNFPAAYAHYLHAAILAKDAHAAERATRIALFRRDLPAALRSTRRWVDLAPNDANARQTALVLFLREGQDAEALEQAEAMLRIAAAQGQDGFLQVAGVLTKEPDRARALNLMRTLVDTYPDDARSHFARAVVESSGGDPAAAEASVRRALDIQPDWNKAWVLLARVLAAQGRENDARSSLESAVQRYPNDTLIRTAYARTLVDAEAYEEALDQFRRLRKQSPEDEDVLFAIGMLGIQTEQWDDAREAWQALRNTGKRYDEATYYLAQVEEQTGNEAVAMGLYGAVKEGELRTDAALRRAQLKAQSGGLEEARELLQQVRVLDNERAVDAYLTETRLLQLHGGRQEQILAVYDTALAAYPGDADLLYNRALYAAEIGRIDWLERDLRQVLEADPDNADALNALGYTLADKTERYEEAYALITKAHKLKPDNAAILDSLGWVYYRLGKLDLALKYLSQALEKAPDAEIAAHLGEVLWVTGDRAGARRVWGEALETDPDDPVLREVVERFE